MDWRNQLYFGDNLKILQEYVKDETVDLICLDPPFNSNASYNVLFKEKSGEESAAQITAFEDTWQWGLESEAVYKEIVTRGPRKLADLMQALLAFLGRNDMIAYWWIAIRPAELHRALWRWGVETGGRFPRRAYLAWEGLRQSEASGSLPGRAGR